MHGKLLDLRDELIEGVGVVVWGKERLWMRWYLPGLPDFGTRDKGKDWNGPISVSSSSHENRPI